jgi:2-polyprenyl-3-methyl-5-hydroxy-6-metoxy-1,4-benzoquinol methylase
VRVDLSSRDTGVQELMDDSGCDPSALNRTYARFATVNRLLSGWRRTYRTQIRPLLSAERTTTLLDIGFGGGDLPRALRRWAVRDGLRLTVDAVDSDPRAVAFVSAGSATPGVCFRQARSAELVAAGERYDLVTSNHLLHHLDAAGLQRLLGDSERLARRLVLHSDLRRSRAAYIGWAAVSWPAARDSFVFTDGLRSIRRSYRPAELAGIVPAGWQVRPQPPFRLLLTRAQLEGSRG